MEVDEPSDDQYTVDITPERYVTYQASESLSVFGLTLFLSAPVYWFS